MNGLVVGVVKGYVGGVCVYYAGGLGCWCLWFLVPGFCHGVVCGNSGKVIDDGFPGWHWCCSGVRSADGIVGGGVVANNEGGGPGESSAEVIVLLIWALVLRRRSL